MIQGASGASAGGRRERRCAVLWVFLILAGATAATAPARTVMAADSDDDRVARSHFRQGEAHYAAGKYAQALSAYQAGYDVHPLPGFLVNIAQCQRRMGDLARARATYGKFILVAPDSPLVPEVRSVIEDLDRLIAETDTALRTPSVAVAPAPNDGESADIMPPAALEANPSGRSGPGPSAAGVDLTVAAAAPSSGNAAESTVQSSHRRWWLWGTGALVLAAGITTVALVLSAPEATVVHDGSLGTLRR